MAEAESLNTMFQNSFVKVGDGNYALKTQGAGGGGTSNVTIDPSGNTVKIDQTASNNAVQELPAIAARATSSTAAGTVTSPAAAAVIATTSSLAIGTWDVEVTGFIGGTTVASLEPTNMRLVQNAVNLGTILVPVPGTSGATSNGVFRQRVQVSTAGALSVQAIAAATTGAIYSATISATRVM